MNPLLYSEMYVHQLVTSFVVFGALVFLMNVKGNKKKRPLNEQFSPTPNRLSRMGGTNLMRQRQIKENYKNSKFKSDLGSDGKDYNIVKITFVMSALGLAYLGYQKYYKTDNPEI